MWRKLINRSLITCALIALVAFVGCTNSQQQPQTSTTAPQAAPEQKSLTESEALAKAKEHEKALTGGGKVSPICSMFTQHEIELMFGAHVKPGETSGPLGTACTWEAAEGEGSLQIQVIDDVSYWGKQTGSPEYEHLAGIGKDAFVCKEFGSGYTAQAVTENEIVAIGIHGASASRDAAVAVLKNVLDRMQKNKK